MTIKNKYPLPSIDYLFDKLEEIKVSQRLTLGHAIIRYGLRINIFAKLHSEQDINIMNSLLFLLE